MYDRSQQVTLGLAGLNQTLSTGTSWPYNYLHSPKLFYSVDTLNSHVQGVKHVKKKIAMEAKNDRLRSEGLVPETKLVRQVSRINFQLVRMESLNAVINFNFMSLLSSFNYVLF